MSLKNKDLSVILESFLRVIRQHRLETIPVIAVVLTNEGKLVQFSARSGQTLSESIRYLETGVSTMVREGKCRALGLSCQPETKAEGGVARSIGGVFLEHRDGTAYRIELADFHGGSLDQPVPLLTEPKFFPRSRFAQAR